MAISAGYTIIVSKILDYYYHMGLARRQPVFGAFRQSEIQNQSAQLQVLARKSKFCS